MNSKPSFWDVYAWCVVAAALAVFILELAPFLILPLEFSPFLILPPPVFPDWMYEILGFAAMAILATVFGIGAMRRPVASLVGVVVVTVPLLVYPINQCGPSMTIPFIWVSWLQGTLARWVLQFFKFVRYIITRPDGAAEPISSTSPRD